MSMIKCPECGQRVSSLAGTCPHCGVAIRGMIRQCPQCQEYVMKAATVCPHCSAPLPPVSDATHENDAEQSANQPSGKKGKGKAILTTLIVLVLAGAAAAGGYWYWQQEREAQLEQERYIQLDGLTAPDFYRQYLEDFPQGKHFQEVQQRMDALIQENGDWQAVLAAVSRQNIEQFMQKHPQSARGCLCENMLDSIDWAETMSQQSPEAIDTYLSLHPEGQHVTEAANLKNELAMTKITADDRALIKGVLETFLNNGLSKQDTTAISQCTGGRMDSFCGTSNATPSQIAAYAHKKMDKDVIGLHYTTGSNMDIRRHSLPDSSLGYAVEFAIDETLARKDATQNSERHYRASALLNAERKIVRLTIR